MHSTVKNITRILFNKFNFQPIAKCSLEAIRSTSQQTVLQNTVQKFGQPTPQSHPHILKEGEVVPGIKKDEFKSRRNNLMKMISKLGYKAQLFATPQIAQIIIIPSATKVYVSDKIPYVFRQNTDFLYFTGCQEPDSALILTVNGDHFSSILFMRHKDEHAELWDGPRTGVDAALSLFGVDQVLPIIDLERFLLSFLSDHKKSIIWYNREDIVQSEIHQKIMNLVGLSNKERFSCPKTFIHQLRMIKSQAEINLMKKSCEIASASIAKTIEKSKCGMSEHELYATVDYECRMRGAEFLAYPPVVAGGKNANIIHYISNNQIINEKEMVLMDAGCEYHGYTSDITRTWSIDGTFTKHQRILYEIVLDVQKILIEKLKEMPSLDMVYNDMCSLLGKRLQEECLIPKHLSSNNLLAAAFSYCPHHVSHYLGMDVHDTSKISRSIRVQPGMIVTVEPGIYVNPKNQFAPPEFHHLGIRIEDDILIQECNTVILTESCPKEVSDIETLARKTV